MLLVPNETGYPHVAAYRGTNGLIETSAAATQAGNSPLGPQALCSVTERCVIAPI